MHIRGWRDKKEKSSSLSEITVIKKNHELAYSPLFRDTEKISKELSLWGIENGGWEKMLFL